MFGLDGLPELAAHKTVPVHSPLDLVLLRGDEPVSFRDTGRDGILLLLYYRPLVRGGHASVEFIMTQVPFGWLVRLDTLVVANLMIGS